MERSSGLLERGAHLGVLWTLAVSGPLLELLGDNPEFFSARHSSVAEVIAFAALVAAAGPLVLLGLEWLVQKVSLRMAWTLHLTCVSVLCSAIALHALRHAVWWVAFALALLVGVAGAAGYARTRPLRSVLTLLSPAPAVVVLLFLLGSGVLGLVAKDSAAQPATERDRSAPVVLVIFDEFPVQSLMDRREHVDRRLYPNFARLAADATWYRDTASVEQDTPYAVPAILDGRIPRRNRLPVAADHPHNLFTLLDGRYDLHVREEASALCPPTVCATDERPEFSGGWADLWGDAQRLYTHLVVPDDLEGDLPSVAKTWRALELGAGRSRAVALTRSTPRETKHQRYVRIHANLRGARPTRFERFVSGIPTGPRPALNVVHVLLPHVPFQYLPSGKSYRRQPAAALPGLDSRPGFGIPFLVRQGYQRHLLQLGAADRLLGELLDRLRALKMYRRSLIAVVADHGVSFRVGHDRRFLRADNVQDIAPVPFFVKAPGQTRGRITDKPLRTIDVLPTVADLLGIEIPWKIDGRSARAPTAPAQRSRRIIAKRFAHTYPVDTPGYERDKRAALKRKLRLFGGDPSVFGPRSDLIGTAVGTTSTPPSGGAQARIAGLGASGELHPSEGFAPVQVAGRIVGGRPGGGRTVALALNGRIEATGLTFSLPGAGVEQFSLLLPERALTGGRNEVSLFSVRGRELRPLGP
jgi:Sulfatase